jgi:hypothetical protein
MKTDPPSPSSEVTLAPSGAQAIDFGQKVSLSTSSANGTSIQGVTWKLGGAGSLSGQIVLIATLPNVSDSALVFKPLA